MARGRKLTPAEAELWQKIAKGLDRAAPMISADPLPDQAPVVQVIKNLPPAKQSPRPRKNPPAALVGQGKPATSGSGMDKRNFDRLRKGKLAIDARLDLHGMTVAQAHPRLIGFVMQGAGVGHRLLLIITGKGSAARDPGPIPVERGILRRQVPQWLASPPLVGMVLQVLPASRQHGGDGAYYVYLRKS